MKGKQASHFKPLHLRKKLKEANKKDNTTVHQVRSETDATEQQGR